MNRIECTVETYPSGVRILKEGVVVADIDIQLFGVMLWQWNKEQGPNKVENYAGPSGHLLT